MLHRLEGTVRIRLSGYSPERFLNLCNARGLEIWDIRCVDGDYEFNMTLKGFRRVRPVVRKSKVRLKIVGREGFPFFLRRNRTRKLWALGAAGFFFLLYGMSLFIWDIEFQGNYQYTDDTLNRYLNERDIACGMWKSRVDCPRLESDLRSAFPEISWVSARVMGTRLLVEIKENQVISSVKEEDEGAADLAAGKDGVIRSMIVRSGQARTAVGDRVQKGQVLIAGTLSITDDSGQEVRSYEVRADGDVWAETVYTYQETIPLVHQVRIPTGREKRGWSIRWGELSYTCLLPSFGEREWDYEREEKQVRLFGNFYLPIYISQIRGREMEEYERPYTQEEILELAADYNRRFAENLEEKGVQILENDDRIERSAENCILKGELTVLEQIGEPVPIQQKEEESVPSETQGF